MSKLARNEIAKVLTKFAMESGSKTVHMPALYCNVVTDLLKILGFKIRYYDFPYVNEDTKAPIIHA